MRSFTRLAAVLCGLIWLAAPSGRTDAVTDWNAILDEAVFATAQPVPAQPRSAAIVHIAIFDAVNGIDRRYTPYHVTELAPPGARAEAAAVQAAYTTLVALYPAHKPALDTHLAESIAKIPGSKGESQSIARGLEWGEQVAHQILALRSTDHWTDPVPPFLGGFDVGQWRSIPFGPNGDGAVPAVFPQNAILTPFAMSSPSHFRPGPPYGALIPDALLSAEYAADFAEVKAIGRVDSALRTPEQTSIAALWQAMGLIDENRAARSLVPVHARLVDNARLFALINMVGCDALIIGWDSKFAYELWRPHHAIRLADTDGNPATVADPDWTAVILAPRFPEYVSNHSVLTSAVMHLLASELGDEQSFTLGSPSMPGFTQSYERFSDATAQVKEARIWGGIHFRHACTVGGEIGVALADYLRENFLTALPQSTFTKVTEGEIATDRGRFASAAWGDFSNRGLLDLYICNYEGTNVFYHNNGDGTFSKIPPGEDPVRAAGYHVGPVAADFNNDGNLDLFVSAGIGATTPQLNILYRNNGMDHFTPSDGNGITNFAGYFNVASWSDYDNDGLVDLFVPGVEGRSVLFHNDDNDSFTRILSGSLATDFVDNSSVSWADYDNDGFAEVFINSARNYLYHNNRNGTFTRVTTNAVATDTWPARGWGASWGDYDNDGLPDLFIPGMEWGNRLYHNEGNGAFARVAAGEMLSAPTGGGSRTCAWGDYDNDGYLDLFVASYNATNRLFHNNGNGTFTQVLSGHPVEDPGLNIFSQTCGWADYDNDGFLDLLVTRFTDNDALTSNLLYHNDGRNSNAWLEINLVGTVANRSAIGAKVRVRATIGGKTFWQMREINTGGGRWAQPLRAHFGLGDATNVDTVRIEWPSGTVQELRNVPAKQILTYVEPPQLHVTFSSGALQFVLKGADFYLCPFGGGFYLDSSTDWINWTGVDSIPFEKTDGVWQKQDVSALGPSPKFYRARLSCAP